MIWLFIGLQFVLTLASYLRWLRIAQREHFERGRLMAVMQEHVRGSGREKGLMIAVVVLALLGVMAPIFALVASVLWSFWPRSLPLVDKVEPVVWTPETKRLAYVMVALHLVITVILVGVTGAVGLFVVSLLPLAVISIGELGLFLTGQRTHRVEG